MQWYIDIGEITHNLMGGCSLFDVLFLVYDNVLLYEYMNTWNSLHIYNVYEGNIDVQ